MPRMSETNSFTELFAAADRFNGHACHFVQTPREFVQVPT